MAITRTTRTHLVYQFIILTLLFLGIGYNELLPDRKFVLFLAFVPMFCYQLVILSCCMELLPVPSWMTFCENTGKSAEKKSAKIGTDSLPCSAENSPKQASQTQAKEPAAVFADLSERIREPRRREKCAVNLETARKHRANNNNNNQQKSKSWMNLSDSIKSVLESSLSREGSLDVLATSDRKLRSSHALSKADRANYREERANKAKSWRPSGTDFGGSSVDKTGDLRPTEVQQAETVRSTEVQVDTVPAKPLRVATAEQDELAKSYSFPFRQKRLETWIEMKETRESNQSLSVPYWQTVGYNLAVKYEARRRRRAVSSPTKLDSAGVVSLNLQRTAEISKDFANNGKQMPPKKSVKSASYCINKIKTSFTNLVSKKKDEVENVSVNPSRVLKPTLSFKSKNKNVSYKARTEDKVSMPDFPQFLSTERPLIFYPKCIPFEKERFETDVQKKMVELVLEQKGDFQRIQHKVKC